MAARQVAFKNQKPKPSVGRGVAVAAVNTDKSNVKSKTRVNTSLQQPKLTGFLKEP